MEYRHNSCPYSTINPFYTQQSVEWQIQSVHHQLKSDCGICLAWALQKASRERYLQAHWNRGQHFCTLHLDRGLPVSSLCQSDPRCPKDYIRQ